MSVGTINSVQCTNLIQASTTTVTSASTLILTVASTQQQLFTGSTTHTVRLPVVSTLSLGQKYEIINTSTGAVAIQSSGANAITSAASNTTVTITCILLTGTSAASWDYKVVAQSIGGGGTVTSVGSGTGLTGGPITSTGTLSLANTAVTPGSYGSSSQSPSYTVDAQGRLTAAANTNIDHDALTNYVANEHINHSTVSITAGTGLSGGGDITTSRTLNLANTAVTAGSYTWTDLTVDAQGRLTAASSNSTPVTSFATTLSGLTTNMSTGAVSLGGTLAVAGGGTGGTSFTAGGVIYGNAGSALGVSAAGTSGQLLISGGAMTPTWTSTPTVTSITITESPITNAMHAVTKEYVDAAVSNLNVHAAVYVATTSATELNAGGTPIYDNGMSGVGATLTAFSDNMPLTIDGYTFIASDVTNATRILVKDQVNQTTNGIYNFTQLETAILPWVLTRATDADNSPPGEFIQGDFSFVQAGTMNASTGWVETCVGTGAGGEIDIGTDNVCYTQISGAGTYSAGSGLSLTGTTFSVATGGVTNAMLTNSSLTVTAGSGLTGGGAVSLGGSTSLSVATSGVTNAMLANSSITVTAGTGLSGGGAVSLGGSVALANAGVTSATGTANQVSVSASTGAVTWSLPQDIATTSSPTFASETLTNTLIYTNGIEIGDVTTSTNDTSGLAIGKGATTTADDAIAIGSGATSVGIAIGNDAHTGTGTFNTIVGNIAGNVSMTADNCTALGHSALNFCTDGYEQTAIGAYALALNTSGYRNTAIGYNALAVTDIGDSNVAVGHSALAANTNGYEQVAIGWKALFSSSGSVFNVAVGAEALQNSVNDQNTAVGRRALRLSTGSNNTALGCYAMQNMLNANNNVAMGYFAGGTLTTGNDNVLIGDQVDVTASSVTTAVAVGKLAVVADSGVAIGQGATLNAAATSGIAIGKGANLTSAATGGAVALGASITANQAGGFFVQHRGPIATTVNAAGFIAGTNELIEVTSSRRFKENIRDLESVGDKLDRFRPVRYNAKPGHGDDREHIGLIAEEVEEIFSEFVTYNGEGQVTGMMFDRVVSVLIKEIQEMRQREKITNERLAALENA